MLPRSLAILVVGLLVSALSPAAFGTPPCDPGDPDPIDEICRRFGLDAPTSLGEWFGSGFPNGSPTSFDANCNSAMDACSYTGVSGQVSGADSPKGCVQNDYEVGRTEPHIHLDCWTEINALANTGAACILAGSGTLTLYDNHHNRYFDIPITLSVEGATGYFVGAATHDVGTFSVQGQFTSGCLSGSNVLLNISGTFEVVPPVHP